MINAFPILAILFASVAFYFPQWFLPLSEWIFALLGIIMFTMGMTLHFSDFLQVLQRKQVVFVGIAMQFLIMPLLGWLLTVLFQLSPLLATGLILVGSCPGGTSSNVICFLSKGDVALSVTLTAATTTLAFVATPLLTWCYVGQTIEVPMMNMLLSIVKMVLLPVLLGMIVNTYFGDHLEEIRPILPTVAILVILVVIAIVTALNVENFHQLTATVVMAVILHNILGSIIGYFIARRLGYNQKIAITLAIEVGIQNSGLGTALAVKYFGAVAALPGALFSIWQNVSGSLLVLYWRSKVL